MKGIESRNTGLVQVEGELDEADRSCNPHDHSLSPSLPIPGQGADMQPQQSGKELKLKIKAANLTYTIFRIRR
jgi:hypothetical protein